MIPPMINDTARDQRSAARWARFTWWIAASIQAPVVASLALAWCATSASATLTCPPDEYTDDPFVGWCPGDCNGNRIVAVNELIGLIGMALKQTPTSACAAGDRNADGKVMINEIVSGVAAALEGCPAGVDMLLRNGNVFTADAERPSAEAVAICGERITAVGSNEALRGLADAHTAIIDAGGRTIIPGFNDAHKHITVTSDLAFLGQNDPSLDAAIASVGQQAQRTAPGGRIGALIGPTVLDDPRTSRFALDAVAPDHHAFLEAFTGHGLVFNTRVMTLLGIAEDEPDPPGGFFIRQPDSQIVSGIAHEYAQLLINRQLAAMVSDEAAAGVYAFLDRVFARRGITSVQLMTTGQTTVAAARALAHANPLLRWRIIRVPMPTDPTWPLDDLAGVEAFDHPRVTISGLKYFLDGTPIERLAAMRQPYADREDSNGRLNFPLEEIERMLRSALDAGEQPMFHLGGDRAIDTLLTAMEAVASPETWQQVRPRFEHGDLLLPDLRQRAHRLGAVVVQNPIHFTSAAVFDQRFDEQLRPQLQPMRTLLEEQIPLGLGSDSPATAVDDVRLAVEHPANPPEALTREQAVVAHTSGSAYAEFAEQEKGQLRPGMLADVAVLSQDIFTVPLAGLSNTQSVLTIVGGEIVYRDPAL
jgi:predicted amidohydrolase YtcJ